MPAEEVVAFVPEADWNHYVAGGAALHDVLSRPYAAACPPCPW